MYYVKVLKSTGQVVAHVESDIPYNIEEDDIDVYELENPLDKNIQWKRINNKFISNGPYKLEQRTIITKRRGLDK